MIYLDNHATTPLDPRISQTLLTTLIQTYGNPSSTDHHIGHQAQNAVKTAKHQIAQLVNCKPSQILFTSGATESLNLAIQGTVNHLTRQGKHPKIACTLTEHKAVLDTCAALARQNRINWVKIPVDTQAQLDLESLEKLCAQGLDLICVMAANNEVGTIYPVEEIAAIARHYQIPYLCDATQATGKIPLNIQDWGITMLAFSAHKIYGPKGVGALILDTNHPIDPLIYGGNQQQGLRPGTLNVPGIVALGEACHWRNIEMAKDETVIQLQRDRLQTLLLEMIPGLVINGDRHNRLAGNLHFSVPGIPNSAITARVGDRLAISTGSACTSGVEMPSHVLQAMHLPPEYIEGAIRIGIGKFTTDAEIETAARLLQEEIAQIRALL